MPRWQAVGWMLLIATLFASNHIAARFAFENGANVLTGVVTRSFGTALVVWVLLRLTGSSFALTKLQCWRLLVIGLLLTGQSFCLYSAVARMPVALALLAFNTFPFLLGLLSWLARAGAPSRRTWLAMGVGLVGLALALDVGGKAAAVSPAGVGFALAAALLFAAVLFLTARWVPGLDGRLRSVITLAVVGVLSTLVGLITESFAWPVNAAGWSGLLLLTFFYGCAITSLFIVLPKIGAVNNSALLNFEPVAALTLAWLLLGQNLAPVQLLGMLVVICAIVVVSLSQRSAPAPDASGQ